MRQATVAFHEMRERVERQIEQRTAMLAGVSHDLRTVLTRFRLQLALIEETADVEALKNDVDDMNRMLEGYLAFARGDSGEDAVPTDIAGLLRDIGQESRVTGHDTETSFTGDPSVRVRPQSFKRCIVNLVNNAGRHGDHVVVFGRHADGHLTVTVDDDGPGVPFEEQEAVFKPFYRLDNARNLDESGTGLGLPIARDIARSHGGDIALVRQPARRPAGDGDDPGLRRRDGAMTLNRDTRRGDQARPPHRRRQRQRDVHAAHHARGRESIGAVAVRRIYGQFKSGKMKSWLKHVDEFDLTAGQRLAADPRQERHRHEAGHRGDGHALRPPARRLLHCLQRRRLHPLAARMRGNAVAGYGFGAKKAPAGYKAEFDRFYECDTMLAAEKKGAPRKATVQAPKSPRPWRCNAELAGLQSRAAKAAGQLQRAPPIAFCARAHASLAAPSSRLRRSSSDTHGRDSRRRSTRCANPTAGRTSARSAIRCAGASRIFRPRSTGTARSSG